MTVFTDLFTFIKDSIYTDLLNALNLFDFFTIEIINNITLGNILATFITLAIVGLLINFVVKMFTYPIRLIRGSLR